MDVGGWLRGLGLGQYETNFRDNKINADLLPRLTNDDLKDIGVSALGDRLQLLDAIAALVRAKPPAEAPASSSEPSTPKSPEVSAERRPITVMFCDLVGSTGLAAKLDPEDWRNLVNTYLDEASKAVTGLGGHVLKLMALFGYPQAQENDAERAVRAALASHCALIHAQRRASCSCPVDSPPRPPRSLTMSSTRSRNRRMTSVFSPSTLLVERRFRATGSQPSSASLERGSLPARSPA
jgi:hypothetical protein